MLGELGGGVEWWTQEVSPMSPLQLSGRDKQKKAGKGRHGDG